MFTRDVFLSHDAAVLAGLGVLCEVPRFQLDTPHLCRTPLIEQLAHHRDLCLTTHDDHKRQTFMPPLGFELAILASERPQTIVLDRAATGTGFQDIALYIVSVPLKVIGFSFAPASQFHPPCCYY